MENLGISPHQEKRKIKSLRNIAAIGSFVVGALWANAVQAQQNPDHIPIHISRAVSPVLEETRKEVAAILEKQSVATKLAIWTALMSPLLVIGWRRLKRREKEPLPPQKIHSHFESLWALVDSVEMPELSVNTKPSHIDPLEEAKITANYWNDTDAIQIMRLWLETWGSAQEEDIYSRIPGADDYGFLLELIYRTKRLHDTEVTKIPGVGNNPPETIPSKQALFERYFQKILECQDIRPLQRDLFGVLGRKLDPKNELYMLNSPNLSIPE
jgi:hypothetical protein